MILRLLCIWLVFYSLLKTVQALLVHPEEFVSILQSADGVLIRKSEVCNNSCVNVCRVDSNINITIVKVY
jgi:hypothetical protein